MTDCTELNDNELNAISGGTLSLDQEKEKEEIIAKIKRLYPWAPDEITSKIIEAIRNYGFKAAKSLAQKLTKSYPLLEDLPNLIPDK